MGKYGYGAPIYVQEPYNETSLLSRSFQNCLEIFSQFITEEAEPEP